jgi:aspartokinase/homoserine dehydrogenase 1
MNRPTPKTGKKPLHVLKFGGTSVGDASRIQKVVEIIREASRASDLVVVVSAMSGVTNELVEAATQSEAGKRDSVETIFAELRSRHHAVAGALIHSVPMRSRFDGEVERVFQEGERLCRDTALLRELTLRARDSISSLGERLSAPLLAAALAECGASSEAIEATELVITDSCHGAAEPKMEATRKKCESRLRPLLQRGVIPVVTGFIGATPEGVLTTLGRGGSDYSATIVAASLDADEVTIWTDVDGMMTADPRLVPNAATIPEISYREAAELAHFGAKVLHPKTLSPVTRCGIPVWIRNTFAPGRPGTRITPIGPSSNGRVNGGVKGLTAISDVDLVTVGGPGIASVSDGLGRTFAATAGIRADVLLISQASAQNDICVVVSSGLATQTVEALRREFAPDLAREKIEHITLHPAIAMVTVVGQNMRRSGIAERACGGLRREGVKTIAIAEGFSECNLSLAVVRGDMKSALLAVHREFQLDALSSSALPAATPGGSSAPWYCEPQQPFADGD